MDKYYFTSEIAELLNPRLQSKYVQRQKNSLEMIYSSQKKCPLGTGPALTIPLIKAQTFGIPTVKDISAGDLMHPSKMNFYETVYSEGFSFKQSNNFTEPAGIKSRIVDNTGDNSGDQMKEILNCNRNETIILPSSSVKKMNADLKLCRGNDAFCCHEHKQYSTEENVNKSSMMTNRKATRDKHLVEVLWNLLKIKNHEKFPDLLSSFKAYKNQDDKITVMDLQKMCQKFGLSAPLHVLEKLIEECDIIDKDGSISYEEFIHSLHWKDMLHENINFRTSKYANDWKEGISNPSGDVTNTYRTSSSFIGDHKDAVSSRAAGLPNYNATDRPKLKGVSEFKEYGNASSMVQPDVFTKYGVFEEDLRTLYTKEEIKYLLVNSGILFSDAALETVWNKISKNDKASIGSVWSALKDQCLLHYKYL